MSTENETVLFGTVDYILFFGMLILSALVGAYFGFFRKQNSPNEYLHGGKNMKIFPIASSLVASDISGIILLAAPTDIYMNGSAYSMIILATIIMAVIIIYVFLPVFYNLQVVSSYEYLKLRFSNRVCKLASFIFASIATLLLPVIIYIPALAFNQVSGMQLNIIIPLICLICVFYTTIGGIKAVVWTDTLQMLIMIGSLLVVFFLGVYTEGGFGTIWRNAYEGGRIDFNFSIDPTDKTAYLSALIGLTIMFAGHGSNPIFTQRFLSLPTYRDAKITGVLFCIGSIFFKLISLYMGLMMYSHYKDCAPLKAGYIKKADQILPYYIMEISKNLPGLPGIFIAGLFCAALSTISSGLNTMAGTIYEDFIKPKMPQNTSDKRASDIMKLIVVLLGLFFILLVFTVQYLGGILQLVMILGGIVVGPILALFSLGLLLPFINEKGIFYGSIGGILFISWLAFTTNYYKITGHIVDTHLPLSINGCTILQNTTTISTTILTTPDPPIFLFRITYYYYSLVGLLATTTFAIPISLLTGGLKQEVDKNLLSPLIHRFLSKQTNESNDNLEDIQELEYLNCKRRSEQNLEAS